MAPQNTLPAVLARALQELFTVPERVQKLQVQVQSELEDLHEHQRQLATQLTDLHNTHNLLHEASLAQRKLQDDFIQEQVREPLADLLIPIVHDLEGVATPQDEVLLGFRDRLLDGLRSLRVTHIEARPGDAFDPTCMQVGAHHYTDERRAHQRVANVLRTGFRVRDRVIRETVVELYTYRTPLLARNAQ